MEKQIITADNQNELEELEIVNSYEHGKTIQDLAKEFHHEKKLIKDILVKYNVHIRNSSENSILKRVKFKYTLKEIEKEVLDNYINKGMGLLSSGKKFNLSPENVKYFLRKNNVKIRDFGEAASLANVNRALKKNDNFFSIESRDMAWVLGFLASDGNVSKRNNTIKIALARKDREILVRIKDLIEIESEVKDYTTHDGYDCSSLIWTSAKQKQDLAKYSIVPNKTFILKPPYELKKEYWIDYIRGYFDGDGSVNLLRNNNGRGYGNLRWQVCSATKEILEWIRDTLNEQYGIAPAIIREQQKEHILYYIQYSSIATKQIYEILYTNSKMYLKRKKDHFEEILKTAHYFDE